MRSRKLLLAALAAAAVALPACGSDDRLTVYSGRDEGLVGDLLADFTDRTGIELDVRYGQTPGLATTIVEEGDGSPADVFFSQDAGALGLLQNDDLLQRLPPGILERVQPIFRSPRGEWVGVSARARAIAFDRERVERSELPDSVLDLTDERYSGRVGWAPGNASFQSFVTGLRRIEGERAAEDWLRAMRDNDAQVYENNIAVRDAIAAGEIDFGLINHYYVVEAWEAEGRDYPVGIHQPTGGDAGALVNVAGAGILASSERTADARALVRFLLSDEAQRYFADVTKEYPVAGGVEADEGLVPLTGIEQPDIDLSDLDDLRGTLDMLQRTGVL